MSVFLAVVFAAVAVACVACAAVAFASSMPDPADAQPDYTPLDGPDPVDVADDTLPDCIRRLRDDMTACEPSVLIDEIYDYLREHTP